MSDLVPIFRKANPETLKEILRNAESYLSAQLTVVLAANQRAIAFTNLLAAVTVVLVGGGVSLLLSRGDSWPLGMVALAVAVGLLCAIHLSIKAMEPADFEYCGNAPGHWVSDILKAKSEVDSMAEQAAHYDAMIKSNSDTIQAQADHLMRSARCAWWALAFGVIFAWAPLLGQFLR